MERERERHGREIKERNLQPNVIRDKNTIQIISTTENPEGESHRQG